MGFARTFSCANHKATIAHGTSNIRTVSSQSVVEKIRRKRVKPQRFNSSTDDELEMPKGGSKKKMFHAPIPSFLKEKNLFSFISAEISVCIQKKDRNLYLLKKP
ncbi:hypothetical protein HNY73_006092 [Argiope bruennichi]|uniref:Uncharacterized protein n=1 Tax=Argiope bruennichi TaxID=94029 RepID=A0A8T0FJQ8_ARGBR|nr:hypothetical protein HNY73_006092 [Argiope bruennichi]